MCCFERTTFLETVVVKTLKRSLCELYIVNCVCACARARVCVCVCVQLCEPIQVDPMIHVSECGSTLN